jgi:hypothetical protein
MGHCRLKLDRAHPALDNAIARSARIEPRVTVLARFPGALVNDPAIRVSALGEPPLDVGDQVQAGEVPQRLPSAATML